MKIRITPVTVLFLMVLTLTKSYLVPATLLAALFHECGHLLAARCFSVRVACLEIDLFGAKITPVGFISSYRAEMLLAAAGPLFSLLLGAFLLPHGGAFCIALKGATLALAVFNLLPIRDFDGGRILQGALSQIFGDRAADRALAVSSYLSLLFLFSLSSCVLLRYGQNLSLAVLSASLFAKLFLLNS